MRTKTLLLTAAVLAAGIGASFAQSVFSVNAVGYVNLTLNQGYNLIGNPLNGTNNNVNTVIPTARDQSQVILWNPASQSFGGTQTYFDTGDSDSGWYDSQLVRSATVVPPGEGFFIFNPGPGSQTITFVGDVPQGVLNNAIPGNYSFKASIVPQSVDLLTVGFPGVEQMQYIPWDAANQKYGGALTYFDTNDPDEGFYDSQLVKIAPTPAVGQGFVIYNPGTALNWGRTFSVN